MKKKVFSVFVLTCLATLSAVAASAGGLIPRRIVDKASFRPLPPSSAVARVVVKFHEGTHVRLRDRVILPLEKSAEERAKLATRGLSEEQVGRDVDAVRLAVSRHPKAQGIARLFKADEDALAARRSEGETKSGRELADLDLYYEVMVPAGTTTADVSSLVAELNALPSVEIAYAEPVPQVAAVDIPPTTPSFQSQQTYLGAAPTGINATYAWTQPGGKGQGIRIVDVEWAWRTTHEDMPAFFHTGGTPSTNIDFENHGTAVMGEMVGIDNGYGVTGIANQAQAGYESVNSQGAASAIASAALAGDVVLIEMHAQGPTQTTCTCNQGQCNFIAMEYWQANYDAIANATAAGVSVVEASGNGSANLDDPVYGNAFNRSYRDSGAILVGASESDGATPTCWTNYGSRVDLHGWGAGVVTLGYGDLFNGGGDHDQYYTGVFSGTSSASPIVTGAVASLRGVAAALSRALSPLQARQALVSSGTPQGSPTSKHIGPLPNLAGAIPTLYDQPPSAYFTFTCIGRTCSFDASGSSDDHGIIGYFWAFGDGGTASGVTASHTYPSSSTFTAQLTVTDTAGQTATTTRSVNIDLPPVAAVTVTCSGVYCQADASASSDDRGAVTYLFSWNGGGSGFGSVATSTWNYGIPGNYSLVLTVKDSGNQTASVTKSFHVGGTTSVQTVGYAVPAAQTKFHLRPYQTSGTGSQINATLKTAIDDPLAGDWNGDHVHTIGGYVRSTSTFVLRNTNNDGTADVTFAFTGGASTWKPIAGDWNGDGVDTVGLYDPATATFRLRNSNTAGGADVTFTFTGAASTWLPIVGDWDGDGVDTVGLYDPATSTFYLRNSNTTGGADVSFVFGTAGAGLLPIAGDWDGDGWDSIGVYDPSTFAFSLKNMNMSGAADYQFTYGQAGAIPVTGDWDGF